MANKNNAGTNRRRRFIPDIAISNARISGRPNFAGNERMHNGRVVNSEGNRNFCVDIPEEGVMLADGSNNWVGVEELIEMGWPVKIHGGGSDDERPSYYLPIKVNFGFRPPVMYLVMGNRRIQLGEGQVADLDGRNFNKVDLVVHPSIRQDWDTDDIRVSAYLNEGWFYITMSPFEEAWSNMHSEEDM